MDSTVYQIAIRPSDNYKIHPFTVINIMSYHVNLLILFVLLKVKISRVT